jgi:hypothetical protein
MDYVGDTAAAEASEFETRLQGLTEAAGILFVGVQAEASANGNSRSFIVRIGIRRRVGKAAGEALVRHIFKDEIEAGYRFYANVYEGVSGAASAYAGDEKAGPAPS